MFMNIRSVLFLTLVPLLIAVDTGLCTVTIDNKIFSLNFIAKTTYYEQSKDDLTILWNFCNTFSSPTGYNCTDSFSMVLNEDEGTCQSYSSDSTSALYNTSIYQGDGDETGVVINLNSGQLSEDKTKNYTTKLVIVCGSNSGFEVEQISFNGNATLEIYGKSQYGCPMLDANVIWVALSQNSIIFGLVLIAAGILELFFGRKLIEPTIFIATYCLAFVIFAAIFSSFLTPQTSMAWVYICLLIIIIISSIIAYFALSITYISVFLIGAYMGFIVAILVNSLFIKMIGYTSTWPLVVWSLIFCLIFGYLTFRAHDHIIIISTALNGSYMIIRPISWIFGGFPNELLVAEMIQVQQITSLPSTFFIYLFFILVLAGVGATYQFLKLKRETNDVLSTSRGQELIENSVDAIRNSINQIIDKYRTEDDNQPSEAQNFVQFNEMRKVPLYPKLNDQINNQIKQGLLDKLRNSGGSSSSGKQAPKVMREFSGRSEGPQTEQVRYNSDRVSDERKSNKSNKTDKSSKSFKEQSNANSNANAK